MKPVTQKMIAEKLGVHSTTVSMALRGVKSIPEITRQKILAAAKEMGYQPNAWARNLRMLSSRTIGMISGFQDGDVAMSLLAAISRLAQHQGYEAILLDPGDHQADFDAAANALLSYRVAGMIISPPNGGDLGEALQSWIGRDGPTIYLRPWSGHTQNVISTDRVAGCRLAARLLADLGHTHMACLGPEKNVCPADTMVQLKHTHVELAASGDEQAVDDATNRALALRPRPTAFVCDSDITAVRCIRSLARHGMRVPHDVSVIGFDDCLLAHTGILPLTSLAQPTAELAEVVLDRLLGMINETAPRCFDQILIPPKLIIRESTAKAPANSHT